ELEVLGQCRVASGYKYKSFTPKRDRVRMANEDDLYASIPVHAAQFSAKLHTAGELNVDMMLVGRFEAQRSKVRRDQLEGECAGATHVVTALTVGAFDFYAGADAQAAGGATVLGAGAGGRSAAQHEVLTRDGDAKECEKATGKDDAPPYGC